MTISSLSRSEVTIKAEVTLNFSIRLEISRTSGKIVFVFIETQMLELVITLAELRFRKKNEKQKKNPQRTCFSFFFLFLALFLDNFKRLKNNANDFALSGEVKV